LSTKSRRKFSSEEKVAILKRHILSKEAVSDICDQMKILPNQFYRWEKEFFDNAASLFEKKNTHESPLVRKLTEKVKQLEKKLSRKDEVIAVITEDYVTLKKNSGET